MNNPKIVRGALIILTVITAGVHLTLAPGGGGVAFYLNAAGYLGLLAAVTLKLPFLAGREKLVHYAFMGFTVVTILAWLAIGDKSLPAGLIGYVDKAVELLLLASIWQHLRLTQPA